MTKFVLVTAATLLGIGSAFATEVSYESRVGADVMIRQVVAKRLLGDDLLARSQAKMLSAYLRESLPTPYTSIRITKVECDSVLGGSDVCTIDILDATDDGTESSQQLRVRVKKGDVKTASMTLIAG